MSAAGGGQPSELGPAAGSGCVPAPEPAGSACPPTAGGRGAGENGCWCPVEAPGLLPPGPTLPALSLNSVQTPGAEVASSSCILPASLSRSEVLAPRCTVKSGRAGSCPPFTPCVPSASRRSAWPGVVPGHLTLRSPAVMFCSAPAAASVVCRLSSQRCSSRLYSATTWGLHSHSRPLGSLDTSAKVSASAVRDNWAGGRGGSAEVTRDPCFRPPPCPGPHPPLGAAGSVA